MIGSPSLHADEAWRQLLAGDMKISVQELLLPANRGLLREVSPQTRLHLSIAPKGTHARRDASAAVPTQLSIPE